MRLKAVIKDNCINEWLYLRLPRYIINKLNELINKLEKLFAEFLFNLYLVFKYR